MVGKKIDEFMNYVPFLKEVIKRDFKKKYYKSFLGVAWSMLSPLLLMVVMSIVFSTIFKRSIPYYPVYWFSGNLLFGFITQGSQNVMNSMTANASLIKKMKIPKYFFCISSLTQQFIMEMFSLITYFLIEIVFGVPFTFNVFLFFIPMIYAYVFTLGLGMFLCSYATFLRDLDYLYTIIRRLWLYATPIFYPIDIIPAQFRFLWELNPVYIYLSIFRDLTLNGVMPSERSFIIATLYSVITLILGIVAFKEKEDRFFLYL